MFFFKVSCCFFPQSKLFILPLQMFCSYCLEPLYVASVICPTMHPLCEVYQWEEMMEEEYDSIEEHTEDESPPQPTNPIEFSSLDASSSPSDSSMAKNE